MPVLTERKNRLHRYCTKYSICYRMSFLRIWKIHAVSLLFVFTDKDSLLSIPNKGLNFPLRNYIFISIKPFRWNIHVICRNCKVSSHTYKLQYIQRIIYTLLFAILKSKEQVAFMQIKTVGINVLLYRVSQPFPTTLYWYIVWVRTRKNNTYHLHTEAMYMYIRITLCL